MTSNSSSNNNEDNDKPISSNDAMDIDIDDNETKQNMNKKSVKSPDFSRHHGKSNTIRIEPIPRGFTESHVYDFIMTSIENELVAITLNAASQKLKKHENSKLHDARIGYVVLKSVEDAIQCSSKLNKQQFGGFECEVIISQQSKRSFFDCRNNTKWIKITNIGKDIDEQSILKHIEKHCKISKIPKLILLSHHQTKEHYPGFAYIELETIEDATKCVEYLRNKELNGNKMWVTWKPKPKILERKQYLRNKTKQLILSNLHWTLNHNDILKLGASFGKIEHLSVWNDKSGYPSGRASITMINEEEASKLFDGLNGKKIKDLEIMVAYKQNVIVVDKKENTKLLNELKDKNVIKKIKRRSKGFKKKESRNSRQIKGKNKGKVKGDKTITTIKKNVL